MPAWARDFGINRAILIHSARATVASVASLLLARSLKLPEFYWAPISAIVVILSTINPVTVAWQRFAGTALGAALATVIAIYFPPTGSSMVRGFSFAELSAHYCGWPAPIASPPSL